MKLRNKKLPSIEVLKEYFYYDETSPSCLRWNCTKKDKRCHIIENEIVGQCNRDYYTLKFNTIWYQCHRIIWKMHTGNDPIELIDHIDGNTKNNKISNLREATFKQNNLNIKIRKDNSSGVIGVYWMKAKKKWKVEISNSSGQLKYHGLYSDFEEAKKLATELRIKEHGEWIRKI